MVNKIKSLKKNITYLITVIFLLLNVSNVFACHTVTITETNAVDNGDGTYTYTFDICGGIERTTGFYLNFTGANMISYSASITGPTTLNVLPASAPPISGVGDLEYGDWDDIASVYGPFSNGNECTSITVTFDDPITDASIGVNQQYAGPCTGSTQTTDCFSTSSYTYAIMIDLPNCNGNVDISFDGVIKWRDIPCDGSVKWFYYCGPCANTLTIYAGKFVGSGACKSGIDGYAVYDGSNTLIQSGGSNYDAKPNTPTINVDVSCSALPVSLAFFEGYNDNNINTISWVTMFETNNSHFILEKGLSLEDMYEIAIIKGNNKSSLPIFYEFKDVTYNNLVNYYRLIQVDNDGSREILDYLVINNVIKKSKKKLKRIIKLYGIYFYIYDDNTVDKIKKYPKN
jgi:hypothetical protein